MYGATINTLEVRILGEANYIKRLRGEQGEMWIEEKVDVNLRRGQKVINLNIFYFKFVCKTFNMKNIHYYSETITVSDVKLSEFYQIS